MELVAGVDEVGRGSLAGPVIACAIILPTRHSIKGLKDSKKLSKKKREELFPIIKYQAISIGLGISDVKTIDKYNVREATFLAMKSALRKLDPKPVKAIIDGESIKNISIPNTGIVGGDNLIDSIKAASIIAKVTRDNIMKEYAKIFYEYGFEKNSGYGTKIHIDALKKYRATPIHRKSFRPVSKALPSISWVIKNNRINWQGQKLAALHLKKLNFKKIEIINKSFIANKIDIVCLKSNVYYFINVFSALQSISKKTNEDILKKLHNSCIHFIEQSEIIDFEKQKSVFGHISVIIRKGEHNIIFKENIF